jgi:hypothetical protein
MNERMTVSAIYAEHHGSRILSALPEILKPFFVGPSVEFFNHNGMEVFFRFDFDLAI